MFDEVQFPTNISLGSGGGPSFNTQVVTTQGGAEERIARWASPRRKYNVAYGIQSHTDLAIVRNFFIARAGALQGFRYRDHLDCCSAGEGIAPELDGGVAVDDEDVVIGVGDGSVDTFQLIRQYTSGPVTFDQNITKPVNGTVLLAIDDVAQTEGVDFTVDYTTGIVTMASPPSIAEVVSAGFEYDIPVRFAESSDELFNMSIDSYGGGSANAIELIEIVDASLQPCRIFHGGSAEFTLDGVDQAITMAVGKLIVVQPLVASGDGIILPLKATVPGGTDIFVIVNQSLINTFIIKDGDTLATVKTVPVDSAVAVSLQVGSTTVWHVY